MSRQDSRALAFMIALGIAAILFSSLLVETNPAPHRVGEVTVVEIFVNVTQVFDNASRFAPPRDVAHFSCEFTNVSPSQVMVFGRDFDPSITTVVFVRYENSMWVSFGGENAFVALLRDGQTANVHAVLLKSHNLYTVQAGDSPLIAPLAADVDENGTLRASYHVNGSYGPGPHGTILVNETHVTTIRPGVPVILYKDHDCL